MEKLGETSTIITTAEGESDIQRIFAPSLVILHGSHLGTRYPIDKQKITIGRSHNCDIVVEDENISRIHAEIIVNTKEVRVCDLDSTNGTFVNSRRVSEAVLQDGDLVMFSQVVLKYLASASFENRFYDEMFSLATCDPLTKLFNRRYLTDKLSKEINRARRHQRPLSVLFYDIDYLKEINDSLGHPAGDLLLKESAALIRSQLRNDDIIGRLGGDEFAILCPETSLEQSKVLAARIRTLVEKANFVFNETRFNFTVSIGVAELSPDMTNHDQLMAKADEALYRAKKGGRNQVSD